MKHVFIVNPSAGTGKCPVTRDMLSGLCPDKDWEIYTTRGPLDATAYVKALCSKHEGDELRVYACGGDGTLNEVVSGAVGFENVSVGCCPCGSGNDYVKYYGGSLPFTDIPALMRAQTRPIDLLRVNDRYAVNACHFGFDTAVARTMSAVKGKPLIGGRRAYSSAIVYSLFTAMRTSCVISADGELICPDSMLLCTLANGSHVGGSFKCAPRSKNNDGLIELCMARPVSIPRFAALVKTYQKGLHLDDPRFKEIITYRQVRHVDIDGPEGFAVSIDGEILEGSHISVDIVPSALNFIVPEGASDN
ncbi:MAG: hypothetical protein IJG63_05775 [Oscillospiraceae bacterium]|nr:hypothetical protein [Oscillospiraceae bacterium]